MSHGIIEQLKKRIARFEEKREFVSVGFVAEAGDGIARVSGLNNAVSQELLSIETKSGKVPAIAFNLEEAFIGAIILGDLTVAAGDRVYGTGEVLSIPVSERMLGRVVSPLGEPLDGAGATAEVDDGAVRYPLERPAPGVLMRESVKTPLHTGIAAIDAMIPIGRGQRELVIGDRQTGKTAIVLDAILNQKEDSSSGARPPVYSVYVAVGQKRSKIAQMVELLRERGVLSNTIVVAAPAGSPASLLYLAPFAGCAIGEYFMDRGKDALVVYDDLTKHADAYRELSLLLRRPPGREAYPGDIFYLHARLLERAAKLSKELGGGSLTALPIIETKLGDVSAYIPTNVISITDGQIYLESALFHQGIRPAVNVGLSVSRVGSSAQTKAMKRVAGKLRLELAQFRELAAFVQFASDLDEATRGKISRGELLTDILKQEDRDPLPFYHTVPILYAALGGKLDTLTRDARLQFGRAFAEYLEARHRGDVLEPLAQKGDLDDATREALDKALGMFLSLKSSWNQHKA